MSIKQKVSDFVVLVQSDRKYQVIAILGLVAIAFLIFGDNSSRRRPVAEQKEQGVGSVASEELYDDLKTAVINRLDSTDSTLKSITTELQEQKTRLNENEIRTAEIFGTLIEKMNAQQANSAAMCGATGAAIEDLPLAPDVDDGLESFGEVDSEGIVAPPPALPVKARHAYVGKSDYVRVKLLAGVNAPTDGTPYPVLFKLIGDVQGPDGSALPLGEARILAAAQGSLTDSRALFRLTSISIRYPNGERADIDVDGWIVGEDGIRGMQGVPIDPLGKVLGAAALAGFVGGVGEGLSAAQTTTRGTLFGSETVVDGDLASYAVGKGISEPSRLWAGIIKDRVNELVPAIQVFSGREATAVFSQQFTIPGLYDMLEEAEYDVFAQLD